jgi:hypothetical protein
VTVNGTTLSADASHSAIDLFGVTINYGTLKTGAGGIIQAPSGTSTFFNVAILAGAFLQTNDCAAIELTGTTTLVGGTVTFEGGGTFDLTGDDAQIIAACGDCTTLDNQGTITGAGLIGNAYLTIENDQATNGTIDANVHGATLTLNTGDNHIANSGALEATCGGTLAIDSYLDNCGTVIASYGGNICITANVLNENGGLIGAESCGVVTFDQSCVVNDGNIGTNPGGTVVFDRSHVDNYGGSDA